MVKYYFYANSTTSASEPQQSVFTFHQVQPATPYVADIQTAP